MWKNVKNKASGDSRMPVYRQWPQSLLSLLSQHDSSKIISELRTGCYQLALTPFVFRIHDDIVTGQFGVNPMGLLQKKQRDCIRISELDGLHVFFPFHAFLPHFRYRKHIYCTINFMFFKKYTFSCKSSKTCSISWYIFYFFR